MKRIRMSGKDRFGNKTIECNRCGLAIIKNGVPMTPIYYELCGSNYCGSCSATERINSNLRAIGIK